jgi:hypothetical protein
MPCFLTLIALLFPRFVIVILWLFTNWFSSVFYSAIWLVLGFIFLPVTTLWYSAVINWYGGHWNGTNILLLILAVMIDVGAVGSGYRGRNRRR